MVNENLKEKLKHVKKEFPGLEDRIKSFSGGYFDMYYSGRVEDIDYKESDKYQVAVAKWDENKYSDRGGGTEWTEWVTLYYKEKDKDKKIKAIETENIITRHQTDPKKDQREYWPLCYVSIEKIDGDLVEVYRHDKDKENRIEYKFDLAKQEIQDERWVFY